MSTCKALLSKIINKDAFYEQADVTQNIFAFRVVGICILFYSFVMILNCLHIKGIYHIQIIDSCHYCYCIHTFITS